MFRNQYDYDVTIWSPQGRLHQIEYAMEAVKQGSAVVGIKGQKHSVLAAVKRTPNELASYQKKLYEIDDHVGVGIAGLTADARELNAYMQDECLNHRFAYKKPISLQRLVQDMGNMMQANTQGEEGRPYGVGLLLIGHDHKGPHLYQIDPSANYFESKTMSIGARSQSARTYLEKRLNDFKTIADPQQLLMHALRALRDTLSNDEELSKANVSLGLVGDQQPFKILTDSEMEPLLAAVTSEERKRKARTDPTDSMDTDVRPGDDDRGPPPPPPDSGMAVALDAAPHTSDVQMD